MHLRGCRKLRFILVSSPLSVASAWRRTLGQPMMRFHNLMLLTQKTLLQSPARAYLRMQSAKLRACKGFRPRVQRMRRRPEVTLRGARTWACVLCWSAAVLRKCGARGREIGRTLGRITRLHRDTTHEYYHTAAQHLLPPERASSYGHSKYSVCQHVSGQHRPFASFIDSFVLKSYCRPLQGVQLSILPYRSFWKLILPPCPQKDTKQRFPRHPLTMWPSLQLPCIESVNSQRHVLGTQSASVPITV